MRELLQLVPKPSRYLGIEEGTVHKQPKDVDLHVALAFPDMYEVGMSYLGQKILYGILNERQNWWAERVFTPCVETGQVLRDHNASLTTLESDTPLGKLDMVGFHVTHELCYTNILYMLDLSGIPARTEDRGDYLDTPIIMAGGGCTLSAEPLAPFMDLMTLGEGEYMMVELLDVLEQCKKENTTRHEFLLRAAQISGVYVPSFFEQKEADTPLQPTEDIPTRPTRRVVPDMDDAAFPTSQPIPFGAVHSRLALEIARGCTRGCRFCQAGMTYRPARERSVTNLEQIVQKSLTTTGYDDLSFLSLSTGDFSALKELFMSTVDRCAQEQVSVSLPSLRVGSIDDDIMEKMASIRRTGATLAPEAGSQRLRDVINKGITEEAIITHVRKLYQHGWQQVKLYFMIGLPTETYEDLDAIVELCRKVRSAAGRKIQVTAGVSPFVPKPNTPFQWEPQISYEEISNRIQYLRDQFKKEKSMRMRWHEPESSLLEGIFSRGDRRLADVVETAYAKGAIFSSWVEHFSIEPYLEAMKEHGLTVEEYTGGRDLEAVLPWDHLNNGVKKEFLIRELQRAKEEKVTDDCRYGGCRVCGACDKGQKKSELDHLTEETVYTNVLNNDQRDQEAHEIELDDRGRIVIKSEASKKPPKLAEHLSVKAGHLRIWYSKEGASVFLSQLELQSIFERIFRRVELPLTFSQGFHPLPLISFGRALPIGVASKKEWVNIYVREAFTPEEVFKKLIGALPQGMHPVAVERLSMAKKQPQPYAETFNVEFIGDASRKADFIKAFETMLDEESIMWTRMTKKGERTIDVRPLFAKVKFEESGIIVTLDWSDLYVSPLNIIKAIAPGFELLDFKLTKLEQHMP
ncbi:MAG: TIGR03960 family B12-binding radical SAM protein [Desulfovibrionales bacterium]|nr:TIGR03960 family B12-binding radical SAM protein [Desulfovibrionales bacterium]